MSYEELKLNPRKHRLEEELLSALLETHKRPRVNFPIKEEGGEEAKEEIKHSIMDYITKCRLTPENNREFFDAFEGEWIPESELKEYDVNHWLAENSEAALNCTKTVGFAPEIKRKKKTIALEEEEEENKEPIIEPIELIEHKESKEGKEEKEEEEEEEENGTDPELCDYEEYSGKGLPYVGEENVYNISDILEADYKRCKREVEVLAENGKETWWTSECEVPIDMLNEFENKYKSNPKINPPKPPNCTEEFKQINPKSEAIKNAINDFIVNATMELGYKPSMQRVLILDNGELNTAMRFYNKGVGHIVVPNPYECLEINRRISEDPDIQDVISVPSQTIGEYLSDPKLKSCPQFTSVWLDYFSCFYQGNSVKGIFPREDSKLILEKNLLTSPSIFALTTSLRCGKSAVDQVEAFLNDMNSWRHKYCFEKLLAGRYHGKGGLPNMAIIVLRVTRRGKDRCERISTRYMRPDELEGMLGVPWK